MCFHNVKDLFFLFKFSSIINVWGFFKSSTDDGTGPEKMALIMGPTDRCQHAASIITDLLQSVRAREEGGQVSMCLSSVSMHS